MDTPKTLLDAVRYFSDLDRCEEYMRAMRWRGGKPRCPECESENIGEIKTRRLLKCRDCKRQIYTKRGTIFEDSPLGLDKWFVCVWSIANAKNGISSCELGRALGITQKTAWFMLHRIRLAMNTGTFTKLGGTVESDETFVGGKAANMHASKRAKKILGRGGFGKAIVHGMLERSHDGQPSQVRASVVPDTEAQSLLPNVLANVEPGATVYTDAHAAYIGLVRR